LNEIIKKIKLNYCNLEISTIKDWENCSKIINYKKGEKIAKKGQNKHKLFFVINGSLKAYYIHNDKKIIDWFAFENDFITTSTSYFTNEPSLHYIETFENSVILETSKKNIEILCKNHHDFEHLFRLILSKVIGQFKHRLSPLQFKTVRERYDDLIRQNPRIELQIPLGDIASYLGISQETLSRIRASNKII